ncbi:MAG: hypothetical protein ABI806_11390 [Candidatus Solibacter sp.]
MMAAASFDAKAPSFGFAADGDEKRRSASPRVMEAAELVRPRYEALEKRRVSKNILAADERR